MMWKFEKINGERRSQPGTLMKKNASTVQNHYNSHHRQLTERNWEIPKGRGAVVQAQGRICLKKKKEKIWVSFLEDVNETNQEKGKG